MYAQAAARNGKRFLVMVKSPVAPALVGTISRVAKKKIGISVLTGAAAVSRS